MAGYYQALPVTLRFEGGYANHPSDPGGATMKGVTQAAYDAWRGAMGKPSQDVRAITNAEVEVLYHERYWTPAKCDALPWPASLCHFDASVNHGLAGAAKLLQRAAGVADDGKVGPATLAAVAALPLPTLVGRMLFERLDLYERICLGRPASRVFLLAWLSRVNALRDRCRVDLPEVA